MSKKRLREILEYYANSTLGDLQADGTYKFYYATNDLGVQCLTYDPRLAKEGLEILEKIKEDKEEKSE